MIEDAPVAQQDFVQTNTQGFAQNPSHGWDSYLTHQSQQDSHQWAPWPPQAYQDAQRQPHQWAYMHEQVDHLRQDVGRLTTLVETQGRVQT